MDSTSMAAKREKGSNLGLGASIFNRHKATRAEMKPESPETDYNVKAGEGSDIKGKRASRFDFKRWLVGSRLSGLRSGKSVVLQQPQDQESVPHLPQLSLPPQSLQGSSHATVLEHDTVYKISLEDEEDPSSKIPELSMSQTSPELLVFPPPAPHILYQKDCSNDLDVSLDKLRSKGRPAETRVRENGNAPRAGDRPTFSNMPKRTRSMLNERSFTIMPRYSATPHTPPSRSRRPSSSSLYDKPPLSAPPAGSSSMAIPRIYKSSSVHSSPLAPTSSKTESCERFSRLSNPLPLPPGWTIQPGSNIPVRDTCKLESPSQMAPSFYDSPRASRSRSRNGSTDSQRSARRDQHRRRPSPRPKSLNSTAGDQSSKHTHLHHRSWSLSLPVRSDKVRRMASFTSSLGSILGGHSSESDGCPSRAPPSCDDIDVTISVPET